MSKNAKATAVKLFSSIDQRRIKAVWFMTNTLPASFFCSIDEFKRILERYFARLTRAYGDRLAWYWVIEPTEAGQWHLHMIAMWMKDPPTERSRWLKFRDWNDKAWHVASRCPDEAHLRAGCQIQAAKSWAGVVSYLSGYLSPSKWKNYTGGDTGRVHGLRNGALLPIDPETVTLTPRALSLLRRAIGRLRSRRASGVWRVNLETGAKESLTCKITSGDSNVRRSMIKWLASCALRPGVKFKLIRRRARFFRNEPEWCDEFEVLPDGREKLLGARAVRVLSAAECAAKPFRWVLNRASGHWEKKWRSPGDPAPSFAYGPSELRMASEQAHRLIEWAVREDLRRAEASGDLPF